MKILLTGATGFVGREIAAELEGNGCEVVQVGRTTPPAASDGIDINPAKFLFTADVTVKEDLARLRNLRDVAAVVHSAGLAHQFGNTPGEKFEQVNVGGTQNVVELAAALGVKHFVLISSTAVYGSHILRVNKLSGNKSRLIDEDTDCQPDSDYAASKLAAENFCREFCRRDALPLTILRLPPVLGEGNVGNAARLVKAIDAKRFVWVGKGGNLKTLIYKNDVAKAVAKILTEKRDGIEIFNLAAPPLAMRDFVGEIEKHLQKSVPRPHLSPALFEFIFRLNEKTLNIGKIKKMAATLEKWLSDEVYSAEKIKRTYNFEPSTSITAALEKQIKRYLTEKNKS